MIKWPISGKDVAKEALAFVCEFCNLSTGPRHPGPVSFRLAAARIEPINDRRPPNLDLYQMAEADRVNADEQITYAIVPADRLGVSTTLPPGAKILWSTDNDAVAGTPELSADSLSATYRPVAEGAVNVTFRDENPDAVDTLIVGNAAFLVGPGEVRSLTATATVAPLTEQAAAPALTEAQAAGTDTMAGGSGPGGLVPPA